MQNDEQSNSVPMKKHFVVKLIIAFSFGCILFIVYANSSRSRCLIKMPRFVDDLFRQPTLDCRKLCGQNMHNTDGGGVPRLSKVARTTLVDEFAYAGRPVVLTDCAENWTALNVFDLKFFHTLYSKKLRDDYGECQFFKYKTNFQSLKHALDSILHQTIDIWYIGWSNCDNEIADILRQYYSKPYFLPEDSESASTDWIFMGTPGYGAHKHVDNVRYPSWQTQIKGSKKWILYPPPECYYECENKEYEVILNKGDTIVIDTNVWYHETHVMGDEISISIGSEFD